MNKSPQTKRPALPTDVAARTVALQGAANEHEISLLVLFGSRAQGRARVGSDYDLGVLLDGDSTSPAGLRELSHSLQKALGTDRVDVAILNRASALLQYQVARTGIPIVERQREAFADFCVRSLQRHNDSRDFYEAERTYLRRRFGLDEDLTRPR